MGKYVQLYPDYIAETEFVLKVRGDESYSNIEPIISKIIDNPEKYITNNILFKKSNSPLHPSDHMIGGRKDKLIKGFELAKKICEKNPNTQLLYGDVLGIPHFHLQSETLLFCSWLIANHYDCELVKLLKQTSKDWIIKCIMKKYTDLVKTEDLGKYIISIGGRQWDFLEGHPLGPVYTTDDNGSIKHIDEV